MDIGIRFPSNAEVIAADAARFRALSPDEQSRELAQCLRMYRVLKEASGDPEKMVRFAEEEEKKDWIAVQEFVARHG